MVLQHQQGDSKRVRHWINANSLPRETTRFKYFVALYWAFTTMTTVGYGDIMIVNNTERLVAMFAMIVGGACFGYIIGGVTSILEDLDLSSSMYNEKMDAVKEYIYDRQYPPVLAAQIKKHFKSIHSIDGTFDMVAMLEILPTSTVVDLVNACCGDLICSIEFLRCADSGFVVVVAPKLFPCTANEGEFIFYEGSVGTHLFMISSGLVSILLTTLTCTEGDVAATNYTGTFPTGIFCGTYSAGQVLGDITMLLTFSHLFSAYVRQTACLYSIKNEDFVEAIKGHDTTRDYLMQVASEAHQQLCNRRSKLNGLSHTPNQEDIKVACEDAGTYGVTPPGCKRIDESGLDFESGGGPPLHMSSHTLWCEHKIIHPDHTAKMIWDAIVCLFIIYSIVAITYTVCFEIIERPCSRPKNIWMSANCVLLQ